MRGATGLPSEHADWQPSVGVERPARDTEVITRQTVDLPVELLLRAKGRMRMLRHRSFGAYVCELVERDLDGRGTPVDDVAAVRDAMTRYPGLAEFLESVTGIRLR